MIRFWVLPELREIGKAVAQGRPDRACGSFELLVRSFRGRRVAPIYADLLRATSRGKQQVDALMGELGWPADRHRGYGHLDANFVRSLAVDIARARVGALADLTLKAGIYHVLLADDLIAENQIAAGITELRRARYVWRARAFRALVAAEAALAGSDYAGALHAARRAIRQRRDLRSAHALAGFVLLESRSGQEAATYFDNAASLQGFEPMLPWAPLPPVLWKRAVLHLLARWDKWRRTRGRAALRAAG